MAMRSGGATKRVPFHWAPVLHFANARPTPGTWQAVLLKHHGLRPRPGLPVFGFTSLAEVEPILAEFRRVLARLANAGSIVDAERSDILDVLNARARGVFKRWRWARGTGRAFSDIVTKNESFEESLYAQLGMALTLEPFTTIKQCRQCEQFFYEPRRSRARFCSAPCRVLNAKMRAGRYRQAHPDEYRDYQRRLMAKRRQEKKG